MSDGLSKAGTLLVIGIHREELAFGAAVAAGIDTGGIDVLKIPEGLPGRHPRPDERFQHDTLHRALYLQLLPHVRGRYGRLIDLHAGFDADGPSADIYCRAPECLPPRLLAAIQPAPRLVRLGAPAEDARFPNGKTVIPEEVWQASDFLYLGLEVYLPKVGAGSTADHWYARQVIQALASVEDRQLAPAGRRC